LLLKDGENVARRVAGLELDCEWMGKQIFLRPLFVRFQGVIDDQLEFRRRGGGEVSVRHMGKSEGPCAEGTVVVGVNRVIQ
jgi:hypothetical protein